MMPTEIITTKSGKMVNKQECIICDATGSGKLVLWESNIGCVTHGKCYQLQGLIVREYKGLHTLSITDDTQILHHDDFPTVSTACDPDCISDSTIEGVIIGVMTTDGYVSCINCKSRVDQIDSSSIGRCSSCSLQMKISKCELYRSANVIIRSMDGKNHKARLNHNDINILIADTPGVTLVEKLLNTATIKLAINSNGIASIIN